MTIGHIHSDLTRQRVNLQRVNSAEVICSFCWSLQPINRQRHSWTILIHLFVCILVQVDQPVRTDNIHPFISPFIQVEARLASTLAISSGFSTRWWLIFFSRATRGGDSYLFASYGDCCKKCQIYIRHQSCSYKCKDNLLRSSGRSMSLCMEMKIRWSFNSSSFSSSNSSTTLPPPRSCWVQLNRTTKIFSQLSHLRHQ